MWYGEEALRAPMGDFPPPYASAWGDDESGLFAEVVLDNKQYRLRWIEPKILDGIDKGYWMIPSLDKTKTSTLIEEITKSVEATLVYEVKPYNIEDDPEKTQ